MWFTWILAISGFIGFVLLIIDSRYPDFPLPQWAFWGFMGVIVFCFLSANVQLFAKQEKEKQQLLQQIAELEAVEAKLKITLQRSEFEPSRSQDSRQFREREIDPYGYDKYGLPDCAGVFADIEIENVGDKPGELVIGLDDSATELPGIFAIDENTTIQFGGSPPTQIQGQDRLSKQIMLAFAIKERSSQAFARALQTPQSYKIVLKYYTKRIGSTSEEESLVIEGDLEHFREKVIEYWQGFRFSELAEIAERRPESENR